MSPGLIKVLWFGLAFWAVVDCLQRRENISWFFIIAFVPIGGPLIYFAWTRDWLGTQGALGAEGAAGSGGTPFWRTRQAPGRAAPATVAPRAWQDRGIAALRRRKYPQAIQSLEQVLAIEGPRASNEARYHLALAYLKTGRHRDAAVQLGLVIRDDKKFKQGRALLELADCHVELGDEKKALELYHDLTAFSGMPHGRYNYGVLLENAGRRAEALEQMQGLIADTERAPDYQQHKAAKFVTLAREFVKQHG